MVDVVSSEKRSQMMSGIKGKNTKPEIAVRKALFRRGLRYRLHKKGLQGKPDLVFSKYRTVIFVHGCFWHGHGCRLFKWPKSNPDFWQDKIHKNIERDARNMSILQKSMWQVLVVWECALRGTQEIELDKLFSKIETDIKAARGGTIKHYAG